MVQKIESFELKEKEGISFLHASFLQKLPCLAGFTVKPFDFSKEHRHESANKLMEAFGCRAIVLVEQVHGRKICAPHMNPPPSSGLTYLGEGDAIFLADVFDSSLGGICCGIMTADCTPVFLRAGSSLALIHAGWRGLAAGIVEEALQRLLPAADSLEVIVGPCADPGRYEVGEEVISALGVRASCIPFKSSGKYLLSLSGTVKNIIARDWKGECRFAESEVRTITSELFHSHRKEGAYAGRNLMFAVFPQNIHSEL